MKTDLRDGIETLTKSLQSYLESLTIHYIKLRDNELYTLELELFRKSIKPPFKYRSIDNVNHPTLEDIIIQINNINDLNDLIELIDKVEYLIQYPEPNNKDIDLNDNYKEHLISIYEIEEQYPF